MKYNAHFALLISAVLLSSVLTACGTGDSGSVNPDDADRAAVTDAVTTDADATEPAETKADSEPEKNGSTAKSDKTNTKTDSKTTAKTDTVTTAKTDSGAAAKTTAKNAESGNGSGNSAQTEKSSGQGGNNQKPLTPDDSDVVVVDDPEETEEPVKVTKHIILSDSGTKYDGDGIYVNGSQIIISKGGTYEITGTLSNGQIYIETDKKKVKLHLNNASITNHAGSAIFCQNAKKVTVNALADTVNYLEDGGTHDEDKGTIFSEDTVVLTGEGELNIKANYAHGVQSDDDIRVNGGKINIVSAKSGLHSNDGIEINGGVLFCDGGTNGIKTDGYITVTGGSSVLLGGTREEKGAIYCDGSFTVTGGNIWAIGNTCTSPDASTTTANVVGIMFSNSQAAGTLVSLSSGGNTIYTMTSPRNFKYVVFAGPNLLTNGEYNVSYGGEASDEKNYVYSGAYSGGTDGGTFTAGNTVTFYTVS